MKLWYCPENDRIVIVNHKNKYTPNLIHSWDVILGRNVIFYLIGDFD